MQTNITDKDRLNTLNALFIQEGKTAENGLPFSRNKLDYLRPLMVRLNQVSAKNEPVLESNHSATMLRQMIDELLLEITAQVNWSFGSISTLKRRKVVADYGLILWNQFTVQEFSPATQVA